MNTDEQVKPALSGFGAIQAERSADSWYVPAGTFNLTEEEMSMPISLHTSTNSFGTAMFLKVGDMQGVKVNTQIAEAIWATKREESTIKIDLKTVEAVRLTRTAKADAKMREKIYRVSFSWS